ncbi:flavodoxin [Bacillus freudenreichii]|nr:flavodoxin [Bacillus freudenreichii]
MGRVLLLYASMTGNTEEIASIIEKCLVDKEMTVTKKGFDTEDIRAEELLGYDGIVFGTYTYDDGDLPWEVEDFYEELLDVDLDGKIVSVFGSGDSFYPEFGKAVDTMAERFTEIGAVLVGERVKVELDPGAEDTKRCEELTAVFCEALNKGERAVS